MKNVKFIPKLAIMLGLGLILIIIGYTARTGFLLPTELHASPGIALHPPAFIKSASAAPLQQTDWEFILEEAGVTAYTKVDQQLDLQFLPTSFKSIRKQTDQYIMGHGSKVSRQ